MSTTAMAVSQNTQRAVTQTQKSGKQLIYATLTHKETQKQLVNVLGTEKRAKKFAAEVYLNLSINPDLADCTPESFVRTAFQYA